MLIGWISSEICWLLREWIVANTQIIEMCQVMKGVDERTGENILQWFVKIERMGNDRIAKRIYVGEYVGCHFISGLIL